MGLYPQPNEFSCGPFALKHALFMLGKFVDERVLARLARTHWWAGTDEIKLARAARAQRCDLSWIRRKDAERARRELLDHLRLGHPTLLCVEQWSHWLTVVHHEGDRFVVLDSKSPGPVVRVLSWPELRKSWERQVVDRDDPHVVEHWFDLHPLVPRFVVRARARLTIARAHYLRAKRRRTLLQRWEQHFAELSRIGRPGRPSRAMMSMESMLRRNRQLLEVELARRQTGREARRVGSMLDELAFVAQTYSFVLPRAHEKRALVMLAAYVAFDP